MLKAAVVVPAYNAARTLDATLASVAGQTVPPGEVVVVDDGSTDDTASIAARWVAHLPLEVIQQANQGTATARNVAIRASGASHIAFLDADDLWLPDHLESLLALHAEVGGIVSADAVRWTPGGGLARRTHRETVKTPAPAAQPRSIIDQNFVFIGSLCSRLAIERAGGFRDGFPGAEDWDLWIRLIRYGERVTQATVATVIYRISPQGLTRGTRIHEVYERVLEAVVTEEPNAELRQVARDRLRRAHARTALARAGDAARRSERSAARAEARRAFGGPWQSRAEAAMVIAAPRAVTAVTDRVRAWRW